MRWCRKRGKSLHEKRRWELIVYRRDMFMFLYSLELIRIVVVPQATYIAYQLLRESPMLYFLADHRSCEVHYLLSTTCQYAHYKSTRNETM